MTYELRQMVLVNIGTNKHETSNRITSIDPRGGASVLGENGVGKTTTLRLIPLFFGHLPSQILVSGGSTEPMVKFVLPTDASAIAFEYQRGSEKEEDLRIAVIRRRRDNSDAPEYRIFRCGYRQDLFVKDGRFLTDEESQQQASLLDIEHTGILTTSHYRAVILKTNLVAKDKKRMQGYSRDYSFGPKQLDNLDRLVAAMVKKHINFSDIVQVAMSIVQLERGHGTEKAQLSIRHGRSVFERWLSNHTGCVDAMKLAPKIEELEDALKEHRSLEAKFRERRADVRRLKAARESEKGRLETEIATLKDARAQVVQKQTERRDELTGSSSLAASLASSTKLDFETAQSKSAYFEREDAAHWDTQVQLLPGLRSDKSAKEGMVSAAIADNKEASERYGEMEIVAERKASIDITTLEGSKKPYQDSYDRSVEGIRLEELKALEGSQAQDVKQRDLLNASKEPLIGQRGYTEGRVKSPAASEETLQAQATAAANLLKQTTDIGVVANILAHAVASHIAAKHTFTAREGDVRRAKVNAEQATEALELAQKRLNPDAGTLMSALRMHGDEAWKANLAKIINPDLLVREDLDPRFVADIEDNEQTAYGWQFNTGAISAPNWTDDTALRLAIDEAIALQAAAQKQHENARQSMADASTETGKAKQAEQVAQARHDVLAEQLKDLKTADEVASQLVKTEKSQAKAKAEADLIRIKREISEIDDQIKRLSSDKRDRDQKIKQTHHKLRLEALDLRDGALKVIDQSIKSIKGNTAQQIVEIRRQLNEHLSEAGIDVIRLDALKEEVRKLGGQIDAIAARESLTQEWHKWLAAGGNTRVETLRSSAESAASAAAKESRILNDFIANIEIERKKFEIASDVKQSRVKVVDDDIAILTNLDDNDFDVYQPLHVSMIDPHASAKELSAKVKEESRELKSLATSIGNMFASTRGALTGKDNAVRELIEASLLDVTTYSEIGKAETLCSCYKLIGPQVISNVNTEFRALLANIGAFQQAFGSFETEVATFNKRLQVGLGEVRRFERLKDLQLHLVTNFDGLGFYKSLSKMQEVVRQQKATEFEHDGNRDLPSADAVRALVDFQGKIGNDGNLEVNLAAHITLKGSVTDNGQHKEFKRSSELEDISSNGLTSLILATLLTALLNTIRKGEPVHVPWVTDEVATLDPKNFIALMNMLKENHIDVVTASPELGVAQLSKFAHHYLLEDRGRVKKYNDELHKPLVYSAPEVA